MAKKAKSTRARTTKPRDVKAGKGRLKKEVAKRVRSARERHRQPANQALPGMEQVRDATLDLFCRRIGDDGAAMNELRERVEADKQTALDYMVENNIRQYHHHGIELIVRGGAAKLSVRPYKGTEATAKGVSEGEAGDAGDAGDEGDE